MLTAISHYTILGQKKLYGINLQKEKLQWILNSHSIDKMKVRKVDLIMFTHYREDKIPDVCLAHIYFIHVTTKVVLYYWQLQIIKANAFPNIIRRTVVFVATMVTNRLSAILVLRRPTMRLVTRLPLQLLLDHLSHKLTPRYMDIQGKSVTRRRYGNNTTQWNLNKKANRKDMTMLDHHTCHLI
jgi:hypothetical protein